MKIINTEPATGVMPPKPLKQIATTCEQVPQAAQSPSKNNNIYDGEYVPKQKYAELRYDMTAWRRLAKNREKTNERLQKKLKNERDKYQAELKKLKKQNDELHAKVKYLSSQLYSSKTEKPGRSEKQNTTTEKSKPKRRKGQQRGSKGHGRSHHDNLPIKVEHQTLEEEDCKCSSCNLPYKEMNVKEEVSIIEVEVKAHKRVIKRQNYIKTCECPETPRFITAPPPPRVYRQSGYGVSFWVENILSKFSYQEPHYRTLKRLQGVGLKVSAGTVIGGLKKIKELYLDKVYDALCTHSRTKKHWHADETRWLVFSKVEGKIGYRWYLWVFLSDTVVVYYLDPSRSSKVPEDHLGQCSGILSVDRYSSYKKLAKKTPGIILSFCWAHVRRDFLNVAKQYPEKESWTLEWVNRIGTLFHINKTRLAVLNNEKKLSKQQTRLEKNIDSMHRLSKKQQTKLNKGDLTAANEACVKVLKSLDNHWDGLTVFVKHQEIPMDNNPAENSLRGPVVLRKNCAGSSAEWAGELLVKALSILLTLRCWKINERTWLTDFLQSCADAGSQLPADWQKKFLPWLMSKDRLELLTQPLEVNDTS